MPEELSGGRLLRSKAHAKGVAEGKLVETTNSLPAEVFFLNYAPQDFPRSMQPIGGGPVITTTWGDASTIAKPVLEQCLDLIEQTSANDYQNSETGWSRNKKKKEMKLPDMKYIIFKDDAADHTVGFVSFMVTYEDGFEVVYIYEIHLTPAWQGHGLGKSMLQVVEAIGQSTGVDKVMLTVFRSNVRAVVWYHRLGYVEDEFSPPPRRLRNGTVKEPSYVILSKSLKV